MTSRFCSEPQRAKPFFRAQRDIALLVMLICRRIFNDVSIHYSPIKLATKILFQCGQPTLIKFTDRLARNFRAINQHASVSINMKMQ